MSASVMMAVSVGMATLLRADTTLTALATGGIKTVEGPARNMETGDDRPYIVVAASAVTDLEINQSGDGYKVTVEIALFDVAEYTLDRIDPMWERVYGDASSQSDLNPTYGLHRKTLTLPTAMANGWVAAPKILCEEWQAVQLEDTRFSIRATFTVHVSRRPA